MPIGNYISQYFANLYLSELDHLLKEVAGVRYYYRYADDMVLLAGDKPTLHGWLVLINDWLNQERHVDLKGNYQIFPVESRGIDFVGYVTYHTHCLARKKNKQGLCRELAKLRKAGVPEAEIMLLTASRAGFMQHCDSKHLFKILNMKKFSDLVPKTTGNLTGTKYHIDTILNREIHLTGYKLAPSRFNDDQSLTLQYSIEEPLTEKGPDGQSRPVIDDDGKAVTGLGGAYHLHRQPGVDPPAGGRGDNGTAQGQTYQTTDRRREAVLLQARRPRRLNNKRNEPDSKLHRAQKV